MNIGNETEQVEFKKSTSETKEGLISIAAILNKHGRGVLYFGVKDNGEVVGQEVGKDTQRKLSRDICDHIKPLIRYEISTGFSDDGKTFIEVAFSGSEAPYAVFGKYYQRFADEDKQISDLELERLVLSRQKDYSAWENAESTEGISDVDEDRLKKIIADGNESGRIRSAYTDATSTLTKLGVYHPVSGCLTNAGRVLFSANGPVLLKTAVYAGSTKETFLKLNHFEGNIFECIEEGISFVMGAIDWQIDISGGAKRKEQPEIPPAAIREIIVNAFAHGNYNDNTAFSIEVFHDRVVIYSPGRFPAGFKPEDFAFDSAEPIMLNPKIISVLFKASVIESFGSGFERTFAACKAAGVSYEYDTTKSGFKFVFYRRRGQEKVYEMSKTEKAVHDLLCEQNDLTAGELAKRISRTDKTVFRAIKALKENGFIEREGTDQKGYWRILK